MSSPKRVAVVGYGHLGKFLVQKILNDARFQLVFVWNRSEITDDALDKGLILANLDEFTKYSLDMIIEVAHPIITKNYGHLFVQHADYVIGSPTALADADTYTSLLESSLEHKRRVLVPCGAFWGACDIKKMSDRKTLKALKVTMSKHPDSLKLGGELDEMLKAHVGKIEPLVLYDGPIRSLCHMAPNNVNTMAVAALVAPSLGFDGVQGCLIADPKLTDRHLVEIEVTGPFNAQLNQPFKCVTMRSNPAFVGHVTGNQTYESFFNSILEIIEEVKMGFQVI